MLHTHTYIQQNFGILNFGISSFQFYRTTVNGTATINANKCIWLISNLGYIEPLTPILEVQYNEVLLYTCPCGAWWRIGRVDAFHPKGQGSDSCSSRHVRTLDKSFTHSCLWRFGFGMKFRHSIRAVSGAPLSSSELVLKRCYRNNLDRRMDGCVIYRGC